MFYVQTLQTTGISPFTFWGVKNDSLVTISIVVTKWTGNFGNKRLVYTKDLILLSRVVFVGYLGFKPG